MKKLLLAVVMAVASISLAVAQPRAVGVNIGYGVGVSYQHSLGTNNMIDLAVNIPFFNGIGGICTYDWIDPGNTPIPWNNKGEWHWYAGVGAAVGMYNFRAPNIYVGVAGHIGVEYDFWFPLQLSVDWRPNIGPWIATDGGAGFNTGGLYDGIAIGIRYKF
ncbi:MAG: hypothetical protein ACI4BD_00785 [Paludibacteraceae bacterium]